GPRIEDDNCIEPKMVRASRIWGAGTRGKTPPGYGKYGYGLPSASVSQCRRVTVYSKTSAGTWHSCYLDVDEISSGAWTKNGRLEMAAESPATLPQFITDYLKKQKRLDGFDHGTVVVWEKLDRVDLK